MLFSSYEFLFLFLPACLAAGMLARRAGTRAMVFATLLFSFFFYGYFRADYVLLMGGSILVNYFGGERLRAKPTGPLLPALIIFNLLLLGVFKYADLVLGSLDLLVPTELPQLGIVLPLAISFFTFQQIAYVVDCSRRTAVPNNLAEYALFVSFFPQLIAGPIVRQQEVMRNVRDGTFYPNLERIGYGLSVFAFGLFKKVFFADGFAEIADPIFDRNEAGGVLSQTEAWTGLLAYTLQIYFDFSGYSDMAIGMGIMFGLTFPLNFFSPYKARNIIEFWRRWHITLSSFLRDYFYYPLGGNRRGKLRRYANLMIVMLVGGLWHGADWAFMLWGGIHGSLLVLNHALRHVLSGIRNAMVDRFIAASSPAVTFAAVCLAWVPFRANGLDWIDYYDALFTGAAGSVETPSLLMIMAGFLVVWGMPNVVQLFRYERTAPNQTALIFPPSPRPGWAPSLPWAGLIAVLLLVSFWLVLRQPPNAFIYFQF